MILFRCLSDSTQESAPLASFLHTAYYFVTMTLNWAKTMWFGTGLAGLFISSLALAPSPPPILDAVVLGFPLIWLSVVDLDRFEIPDLANIVVLLGGLTFSEAPLWMVALQVVAVGLALWLFSILAEKRLGKTALGLGDVKLLGAGTAWVGALGISTAILLASVAGIGFVSMMWAVGRRRFDAALPFGPFIAIGLWATWLYGPIF